MGENSIKSKRKRKKRYVEDSSSPSSSSSSPISSSESDDESSSKRHKSSRKHRRSSDRSSSRREKEKRREKRKKKKREKSDRDRKRGRSRRKVSDSDTESEPESESDGGGKSDNKSDPVDVVKYILAQFPAVAHDLEQLLHMIDEGQAVDISGLSEKSLVKYLQKLFLSLNLNENGRLVFLLPTGVRPTLEVVGAVIRPKLESHGPVLDNHQPHNELHAEQPDEERRPNDGGSNLPRAQEDLPAPAKR